MGVDPTVSQREIGSATQKSKGTGGLVSIVSYSPSRGLLRDCATSPINRFAALVYTILVTGAVWLGHQSAMSDAPRYQTTLQIMQQL